jgi:hypothetical protein
VVISTLLIPITDREIGPRDGIGVTEKTGIVVNSEYLTTVDQPELTIVFAFLSS